MEDIDFGEQAGKLTKDWQTIAVAAVAVIAIVLLGLLAISMLNSGPVSMGFEPNKIKVGGSTKLKVTVVNTGEFDAPNVMINVQPESATLTIPLSNKTEPVIGAKSKRVFEFPVFINAAATPGTYKVTATVMNLGEETFTSTAYLEVE